MSHAQEASQQLHCLMLPNCRLVSPHSLSVSLELLCMAWLRLRRAACRSQHQVLRSTMTVAEWGGDWIIWF